MNRKFFTCLPEIFWLHALVVHGNYTFCRLFRWPVIFLHPLLLLHFIIFTSLLTHSKFACVNLRLLSSLERFNLGLIALPDCQLTNFCGIHKFQGYLSSYVAF